MRRNLGDTSGAIGFIAGDRLGSSAEKCRDRDRGIKSTSINSSHGRQTHGSGRGAQNSYPGGWSRTKTPIRCFTTIEMNKQSDKPKKEMVYSPLWNRIIARRGRGVPIVR